MQSSVPAAADPLHLEEPQSPTDEFCFQCSESDYGDVQETPKPLKIDNKTAVLHWSIDEVKIWMQQNVPFGNDKMQECLRAFSMKAIDGLSLLTLQRSHPACIGMSDFDWLLFKAARKRLLSFTSPVHAITETQDLNDRFSPSFWTPPCTPRREDSEITPPDSPYSLRPRSTSKTAYKQAQQALKLSSPKKLFAFPKLTWSSDPSKDEQIEMLVTEVQSLRGEIVSAEERETTLQAQMHRLDEVLRTAVIAGYLYTRTRWVPLLGEPVLEDNVEDMNDWLQKFLVLQGSSIYFYMHATDLHPQGTIAVEDIVEVGALPSHINLGENGVLFAFHITTCHRLRLECSTPVKPQMDSWLTILGADFKARNSRNHCESQNEIVEYKH
ncbi:hypothetical protein KP509_37G000200 [Ceratopteris richardii]|uniref:PH domain-containing protein n=1 Tax=Ceratopteris richardii TaxID=49495 RepID=A0A8T2Q5M5_CERRI|nr:hypothetical protein KP509_37G000200 [Ceratopteris richardii]